ncbi:MAG: hypothetical protein GF370_00860 [Candidatus Nealsonbacteria bacterium]|nr:hypothetical protein [Candidatus Nealsonbacteria bacterium]
MNMKTAIIYKTVLGTTKQYAEWLEEEIQADLLEFDEADKEKLKGYDVIVVGSGTYATKMPLVGYLKKVWEIIKDKQVVILAVGAAPADDEMTKKAYQTIPGEIRERAKYFKLQGKIWKQFESEVKKENLDPVVDYLKSIQ